MNGKPHSSIGVKNSDVNTPLLSHDHLEMNGFSPRSPPESGDETSSKESDQITSSKSLKSSVCKNPSNLFQQAMNSPTHPKANPEFNQGPSPALKKEKRLISQNTVKFQTSTRLKHNASSSMTTAPSTKPKPHETSQKIYIFGNKSSHKDEIITIFEKYFKKLYQRNQEFQTNEPPSPPLPPQQQPQPPEIRNPIQDPNQNNLTESEKKMKKNVQPPTHFFDPHDYYPTVISPHSYRELETFYPSFLPNFAIYIIVFNMKQLLYRSSHTQTIQQLLQYFEIIRTYAFEEYNAGKEMDDLDEDIITSSISPKIMFIGTEDEEFTSDSFWSNVIPYFWDPPSSKPEGEKGKLIQYFRNNDDIYHQIHELLYYYFHHFAEYNDILMYFPREHPSELIKGGRQSRNVKAAENESNRVSKKYNFYPVTTTTFNVDAFLSKLVDPPKKSIWNYFKSFFTSQERKNRQAPLHMSSEATSSMKTEGSLAREASIANDSVQSADPEILAGRDGRVQSAADDICNNGNYQTNGQQLSILTENESNALQLTIEEDRYRLIFNEISDYFITKTIQIQKDLPIETLLGYFQALLLSLNEDRVIDNHPFYKRFVLTYDQWIQYVKTFIDISRKPPLTDAQIFEGTAFLVEQKLLIHTRTFTESFLFGRSLCRHEEYILLQPYQYCFVMTEALLLINSTKEYQHNEQQQSSLIKWENFFRKNAKLRQEFTHDGLIREDKLLTMIKKLIIGGDERDLKILEYFGILAPMKRRPQIDTPLLGIGDPVSPFPWKKYSIHHAKSYSELAAASSEITDEVKEIVKASQSKDDLSLSSNGIRQRKFTPFDPNVSPEAMLRNFQDKRKPNRTESGEMKKEQERVQVNKSQENHDKKVPKDFRSYYYLLPYLPKFNQQKVGLRRQKVTNFDSGSRFYFLLIRRTNTMMAAHQKFEWKESKEHSLLPYYLFQRFIHQILCSQSEFCDHYHRTNSDQKSRLIWNSNNYALFQNICMMTLYSFDAIDTDSSQNLSTAAGGGGGGGGVSGGRGVNGLLHKSLATNHIPIVRMISTTSAGFLNNGPTFENNVKILISLNSTDKMIQIDISRNWQNPFLIYQYLFKQMNIVLNEFYSYLMCLPVVSLPTSSSASPFPTPTNSLPVTAESMFRATRRESNTNNILLMPIKKLEELVLHGHNRYLTQEFHCHVVPSTEIKKEFNFREMPLWNAIKQFIREFYEYHLEQQTQQNSFLQFGFNSPLLPPDPSHPSLSSAVNSASSQIIPFYQYIHIEDTTAINYLKSIYNPYLRLLKYYQLTPSTANLLIQKFVHPHRIKKSFFTFCLPLSARTEKTKAKHAHFSNVIGNVKNKLEKHYPIFEKDFYPCSKVQEFSDYTLISTPFTSSETTLAIATSSDKGFDQELEYLLYSHMIYYIYSYPDLMELIPKLQSYSAVSEGGGGGGKKEDSFEMEVMIYQWILLVIFMKSFWTISHVKYFSIIVIDYFNRNGGTKPAAAMTTASPEQFEEIFYFYELFTPNELDASKLLDLKAFKPKIEKLMSKYCEELFRVYSTLSVAGGGGGGGGGSNGAANPFSSSATTETLTMDRVQAEYEKVCDGSLYELILSMSEIIDLSCDAPIEVTPPSDSAFHESQQPERLPAIKSPEEENLSSHSHIHNYSRSGRLSHARGLPQNVIPRPNLLIVPGSYPTNKILIESFIENRSEFIATTAATEYINPPAASSSKYKRLNNKFFQHYYQELISVVRTILILFLTAVVLAVVQVIGNIWSNWVIVTITTILCLLYGQFLVVGKKA